MTQNFFVKLHETYFQKSTEKLLLTAQSEKQKYSDKDALRLLGNKRSGKTPNSTQNAEFTRINCFSFVCVDLFF